MVGAVHELVQKLSKSSKGYKFKDNFKDVGSNELVDHIAYLATLITETELIDDGWTAIHGRLSDYYKEMDLAKAELISRLKDGS